MSASVVELPEIRQTASNHGSAKRTTKQRYNSEKYQKLALIKSVDKLIKKNDLQSVIGYDNDYYPKQLEDQKKIDETVEVHANLTELKKSCDGLKLTGMKKEKEIEKMRKEIDNMEKQIQMHKSQGKSETEQEKQLVLALEKQQQILIESQTQRKVYEHMLGRMKKDQLIYHLRANEFENDLNIKITQLSAVTLQEQQIKELFQKTKLAYIEVRDGIAQQNYNRRKNLDRFTNDLKQKQDLEQKREERIKRQHEIAESAANDIKDSSLKKWRKLLLVHKVLSNFLKNKMQRAIQQYQHLEIAFQKIKASTGVTDAGLIVQKFLGRESTYSHLLIQISDYEKSIEKLKIENAELEQHFQLLKQNNIDMDKEFAVENYKQKEDLSDQDKLVQDMEEKAILSSLLSNKLQTWIKRNLKKLSLPETSGFNGILDVLRDKLLTLNQLQQQKLLNRSIEITDKEIENADFQRRNVRIKPHKKANHNQSQTHLTNQSLDQGSRDEDDYLEEIQSKDDDRDEEEENRLINQLRAEIKGKVEK